MNTSWSGLWWRARARATGLILLLGCRSGLPRMVGTVGMLGMLGLSGLVGISGLSACSGGGSGGNGSDGGNLTCQEIRTCIWYCPSAASQSCVNDCIGRGAAAAQTTYRALAACSAPLCPTSDDATYSYCVNCEQRCFGDGQCIAETEACVGGVPDLVCDDLCR